MAREMKDSGIEWIGEIPREWKKCKIKNICSLIGSGTTPTSGNAEFYEKGTVNWIQSGDIYGKSVIDEVSILVTEKALLMSNALKMYKAPFIVIAMYGGSVGNTAISNINACTNQACCCIKSQKNVSLKFLFYWINVCKTDFLLLAEGGGQPNISQEKIKNQFFIYPSLYEQRKIVDYLDKKCSEINALSSDIQLQISILENYKKSVITETITKGLNPDVEMNNSGIEWIGKIPKHWEVKRLKYISSFRQEKYNDNNTDILYIGLENIKSWNGKYIKTDSIYNKTQSIIFCKNDILWGKLRPYLAKVYYCENAGCCSSEFLVITMNEIFNVRFFWYLLISPIFIDAVNCSTYGVKMPRANADFVKSMYVPIPSIQEQKRISDFLDKKCTGIDDIIMKKEAQLELLEQYKKSLIYEYITGKKAVITND